MKGVNADAFILHTMQLPVPLKMKLHALNNEIKRVYDLHKNSNEIHNPHSNISIALYKLQREYDIQKNLSKVRVTKERKKTNIITQKKGEYYPILETLQIELGIKTGTFKHWRSNIDIYKYGIKRYKNKSGKIEPGYYVTKEVKKQLIAHRDRYLKDTSKTI